MAKLLTPHHRFESILEISPGWLAGLGIRGLLLDLDGTLLADRATACSVHVSEWLAGMAAVGVGLCVVSNSGRRRVAEVVAPMAPPLAFVCRAAKPLASGLCLALLRLGLPPSAVALVGDQVFTDVLGGNWVGLRTILLRPSTGDLRGETWVTRVKRPFESLVLGDLPWSRRRS